MGIIALVPVDAGVAHHRVLLRCEGTHLVGDILVHSRHIVVRHTVDGNVVHFTGVHQVVAEVLAHIEIRIDLELRLHREVEH